MPFNTLLLTCLQPGQTKLEDSKTKILIKGIKTDETILVFGTDNQSNPDCKLRKFLWDNRPGQRLCDFVIFYANTSLDKHIICFVELKDNLNDLGDAVEQILNTYQAFKQHLKYQYLPKAFIAAKSGSVPQEYKTYQQRLSNEFGQNNYEHDGGQVDFLEFLRKLPKLKKGNVRS